MLFRPNFLDRIARSPDCPGPLPNERSSVTQNGKKEEEARKEMATDRRQFLRNAVRFGFGGAAALLLTSTSRKTLANALTLNAQEMEAARRAQQAQGAPGDEPLEAKPEQPSEIGIGCMGTCEGTCSRGCGGTCSTACGGSCSRGCQGSCSRGCGGTCSRDCGGSCYKGCQGTCSRDCGGSCSRGCQGTCSRGCGGTGTAGYNGH
jgi:hypothetical protein